MPYLKIENIGVGDISLFLLFGATTKKDSIHPLQIGQFGSGFKHSLGILLRQSNPPIIFCGSTKLEFFTKPINIRSSTGVESEHHKVCCKLTGKLQDGSTVNRTEDMSFTLDYGRTDWKTCALALREFISNAIDGQIDATGDFTGVSICEVEDNQVRAKQGVTRIFIRITDDIVMFHRNIGMFFLHFSNPDVLRKREKILRKVQGRSGRANIYRRGVLVRQIQHGKDSIFDYNIDPELNESRTFDDFRAKHFCALALRNAPVDILTEALFHICNPGTNENGEKNEYWESSMDSIMYDYGDDGAVNSEQRKENWQQASNAILGDNGIFTEKSANNLIEGMIKGKGYNPIVLPNCWAQAARTFDLKTEKTILSDNDQKGRTFSPVTISVQKAHDIVWDFLIQENLHKNKNKPGCECFYQPTECGKNVFGYYDPTKQTCYYHTDYAGGDNESLMITAVEECCHHASGATDFSRDMSELLATSIARLLKRRVER